MTYADDKCDLQGTVFKMRKKQLFCCYINGVIEFSHSLSLAKTSNIYVC